MRQCERQNCTPNDRLAPSVLDALKILTPETVIRWHRAGFRAYWRWKSRARGGRPKISADVRQLIREMSVANPLWGAPRITVSCSSSASISARPPWQNTWPSEDGHRRKAGGPSFTIMPAPSCRWICLWSRRFRFGCCMVILILQHSRRELLWLAVTAHPNAEWIARQLTEACGWKGAPRYLVRDRDGAYGDAFIRRLGAMGIRDRPTSARSPWQNGYAERLIGSIRRDCLDPRRCLWRAAPPSPAHFVSEIPQRASHSPLVEEGHTYPARCPERRRRPSVANPGRATPPICSSSSVR
jgi:hypothetical protein